MIRTIASILVMTVALAITGDAFADYGRRIAGSVVQERTDKVLNTVQWHRDLDSVRSAAKAANKPILFLQMVGDLDSGL